MLTLLVGVGFDKLGDGDELITLTFQIRQGFAKRCNGLRAIATAIVHENNLTWTCALNARSDGVHTRSAPVFGVDIPTDLALDHASEIIRHAIVEVAARCAEVDARIFIRDVLDSVPCLFALLLGAPLCS